MLNGFSQSTTPEPYTEEEFPETMHKLRRFEIISLGSIPFVSLDIALGYSGYKYVTGKSSTFVNPFSVGSTDAYSEDEIKGIIISSVCVGACIGVADLVVNELKANKKRKKIQKENQKINITSVVNDPDAVKIKLPESKISTDISEIPETPLEDAAEIEVIEIDQEE